MRLEEQLLKENSKANAMLIVRWVDQDPARFKLLVNIFSNSNYRLNQRAAWPLGLILEKYPDLILPYLPNFIDLLSQPVHDAVKRNILRSLQTIDIPEEYEGKLYDSCYQFLYQVKTPVAIKVFSMTVLANIAMKYPELKSELLQLIKIQLPNSSAGFKSRAKKILLQITNKS